MFCYFTLHFTLILRQITLDFMLNQFINISIVFISQNNKKYRFFINQYMYKLCKYKLLVQKFSNISQHLKKIFTFKWRSFITNSCSNLYIYFSKFRFFCPLHVFQVCECWIICLNEGQVFRISLLLSPGLQFKVMCILKSIQLPIFGNGIYRNQIFRSIIFNLFLLKFRILFLFLCFR